MFNLVVFILILSNLSLYSQVKEVKFMTPTDSIVVQLKLKETIVVNDSLSINLTGFSHKFPYKDGPTKETAYLTISTPDISEEITLSIHGTEGKSEIEEYDSLIWKAYTFQLTKFDYENSITLLIPISL